MAVNITPDNLKSASLLVKKALTTEIHEFEDKIPDLEYFQEWKRYTIINGTSQLGQVYSTIVAVPPSYLDNMIIGIYSENFYKMIQDLYRANYNRNIANLKDIEDGINEKGEIVMKEDPKKTERFKKIPAAIIRFLAEIIGFWKSTVGADESNPLETSKLLITKSFKGRTSDERLIQGVGDTLARLLTRVRHAFMYGHTRWESSNQPWENIRVSDVNSLSDIRASQGTIALTQAIQDLDSADRSKRQFIYLEVLDFVLFPRKF